MMIAGLKYSYSTGGTSATVVQDDSYNAFTEVTIPATVNIDGKTYNVTAVGNNAFYGCKQLTIYVGSERVARLVRGSQFDGTIRYVGTTGI